MHRDSRPWRIVIALLTVAALSTASLLCLGAMPDRAAAQGGPPDGQPQSGKPEVASPQALLLPYDEYLAVQGITFLPLASGYSYSGGRAGCKASTSAGDYFAPVSVPNGSVLKYLEAVYYNPSAFEFPRNEWLGLLAGTDTGEWLAIGYRSFTQMLSGVWIESTPLNDQVVNTYNRSYSLNWRTTGTDTQLCQARLYYRPPVFLATYLPMVSKS